jgi:hypothetical protein
VKYLLAPLMPMPIYMALFVDEKSYSQWLQREKIKPYKDFVAKDANGCCHFFENDETYSTIVAVCLNINHMQKKDSISQAATIIHEAVHVYQECLRFLGETNPGDEFAAYSIQRISEQLMRSYVAQVGIA